MTLPPDLFGAILDLLAREIAARLGSTSGDANYTSADLPPHTSRRRYREICPRIAEARKVGRIWIVPISAWEAHRLRRRGAATTKSAESPIAKPLADRADDLLRRRGLRVVGSR